MLHDARARRRSAPCPFAGRRGATLVESVVSILIVGAVLVTATQLTGAVARTRRNLTDQSCGPQLAKQLMTEIQQASYQEPVDTAIFGPEAGENTGTRSAFDDVDDYHNYSESPPKAKDGASLTEYGGWSRQVAVEYVNPTSLSSAGSDLGLKRITVTVTDSKTAQFRLVALRTRHGVGEQRPPVETTYVNWIGVTLRTGTGVAPIRTGVNMVNQPR